jgi:hypothetical protein
LPAVVTAFAIAASYALVCLGWGDVLRRGCGLAPGRISTDMALGIAALTVVGGLLNLARIAVPVALGVVALVGFAVAAFRIRREINHAHAHSAHNWLRSSGLAAGVTFLAMIFVAATLVPPSAMNVGDDLQKYLAHIARMLQTGTLYGSPLNALGTESPGGQPFLQSFIAAVAPFPYVNAFDALFCFGLCMALAASLTGQARGLAFVGAFAAAGLALIEPQYVNISALYSGSALMLALYALMATPEEIAASRPGPRALAAGLVAAAMVALKPTFLMMAAIMLGAGAAGIAVSTLSVRAVLKWSLGAAAGLALGLLPWALLYAPYYGDISGVAAQGSIQAQTQVAPIRLFSSAPLTWGASGLAYTTAVTLSLVAGALALGRWRHLSGDERTGAVTLGVSALGTLFVYFFVVMVLGRYFADYDTALRYVIPALIAVVPASITLGARFFVQGVGHDRALTMSTAYSAFALAALFVFGPSLAQRIEQARDVHHELAFRYSSLTDTYRSQYAQLTSPEQAAFVHQLQESVPPGAPILAATSTPFRFDFRRNPIYDVTFAGIHAPWAHIPQVDYVIWDYAGEGSPMRNLLPTEPGQGSPRMFGLVKLLIDATKSGPPSGLIYNDGKVAVFRVSSLPRHWNSFP